MWVRVMNKTSSFDGKLREILKEHAPHDLWGIDLNDPAIAQIKALIAENLPEKQKEQLHGELSRAGWSRYDRATAHNQVIDQLRQRFNLNGEVTDD